MRLAVQMYTLRDLTKDAAGFEESLQMIHGIGYPAVQLSAVGCMDGDNPQVTAQMARDLLDENGLACCATHRTWERLRDHTEAEIEFHKTLGCSYTAIGGLWSGYEGAEGMARFAEESKQVAHTLNEAGIHFGYHNHAHEFNSTEPGPTAYDVLVKQAPHLSLEIDVYWAAFAGVDPAELLKKCAGRIQAIHLKDRDYDSLGKPRFAPVGEGDLDWDAILTACKDGGTDWGIVEQDTCFRDPYECLQSSFDYLSGKGSWA